MKSINLTKTMDYTEFEIPDAKVVAIAALKELRRYGSHVVILGEDDSMSVACSESEALDIADPNRGDSFFPIAQLLAELSSTTGEKTHDA